MEEKAKREKARRQSKEWSGLCFFSWHGTRLPLLLAM